MKNRRIMHANQEASIYSQYYKPSFNMVRFTKSILGVLLFGRSTVVRSYIPSNKRSY